MKSWTFAWCVLLAGCAVAPAENVPELKPEDKAVAPLTQAEAAPRVYRPMPFVLPNDEVGLAVRGLIVATEELAGAASAAKRAEAMTVVRARPFDVVTALDRAFDKLPVEGGARWVVASTLADLGIDEALPALIRIADMPIAASGPVMSPANPSSVQHAVAASTREATMIASVAVDGIAALARTGATLTKNTAVNQLFTYFSHPQRMVKETAVVGYLRSQGNSAAAKATAQMKLAAADRYMTSLTWGKNPGLHPQPTAPAPTSSQPRVTMTVPRKK
jgi:hypothetical protein